MTLRMRVLPRFPAKITATNGLTVERPNGTPNLIVKPSFGDLVQIPNVGDGDNVFFMAWDKVLGLYRIMSFNDLFAGVADLGFMTVAVYDPQGKHADAFARANHTGTQAISTIVNLQSALDALTASVNSKADAAATTAALALKLALAGGTMSGAIDLAGNPLKNAGSGVADYVKGLISSKTSAYVEAVSAGQMKGNGRLVVNGAAFSKNLNAPWVAGSGNGGRLSAAAVAANTTYHKHALYKDSDGSFDWGYDVSATAPTIPAGYTWVGRFDWSFTNATPNAIWDYTQSGSSKEFSRSTFLTTSAAIGDGLYTIPASVPVPSGIAVEVTVNVGSSANAAGSFNTLVNDADGPDASSGPICVLVTGPSGSAVNAGGGGKIRTNSSRQMRVVTGSSGTGGATTVYVSTVNDYTINRIY